MSMGQMLTNLEDERLKWMAEKKLSGTYNIPPLLKQHFKFLLQTIPLHFV